MKLKIGDVLNYKDNTGWLGKVIKFITRSKYAHSACYIGNNFMIESNWGGVRIIPIQGKVGRDYDVFRHSEASAYKLRNAIIFMEDQIGAQYDYLGVLGVGINTLLYRKRNYLDDKDKYWCSELVADGYINAKIDTDFNFNTILVSPGDIARSKYFFKAN